MFVLCIYKPPCFVYLQIIKDLVWKPSYNRAIVKQENQIQMISWCVCVCVCVCVAVATLANSDSDVGTQSSSKQKP